MKTIGIGGVSFKDSFMDWKNSFINWAAVARLNYGLDPPKNSNFYYNSACFRKHFSKAYSFPFIVTMSAMIR